MLTRIKFTQAVLPVANRYQALEQQFNWLQNYDVTAGYRLYRNSGNARNRFLVCGRTRIDRARGAVTGSSIEEIDLHNLGSAHPNGNICDVRASFSGNGSILHFPVGWHFFYNDAWLLGGVHAGLEFHLASPRHRNNIIDPHGGFLTVTGRELTGLFEFGYRIRRIFGQEIAYCAYPRLAQAANFVAYWRAIDRQGNGQTVDPWIIDNAAVLVNPSPQNVANWQKSVPIGPQPNFG